MNKAKFSYRGIMKKKIAVSMLVAIITLVAGSAANATEMNSFYRGIRPLGMGDAFTTIANDENAVFYNPAGLASVEKGSVEILNPQIEVGENTMTFYSDATGLKSGDTTSAVNLMKANVGKHQHFRASVFPNYTRHNFELGVIGQGTLDAEIHSPAYPTMSMDVKIDAGVVLGLAHTFMNDKLQVGGTAKYVQRQRMYKDFTAAMVADSGTSYDMNQDKKTGGAIGLDLGAIYFLENEAWKPRVGMVIQNIGDMNFGDMTVSTQTAPIENKIKQSINIGGSVTKQLAFLNTTVAADLKDIASNTSDDSDKGKRLHIGVEAKLPKILTVRAGINQGYISYGLGVDFWLIKLSYAHYKEEVGGYAGQREDARHVVQLSIGF